MTESAAVRPDAGGEHGLPMRGLAGRVAGGAVLLTLALFGLTVSDAFGLGVLWENAHWSVAAAATATLGWLAYRRTGRADRGARGPIALGLTMYAIGQIAWDLQVAFEVVTVPAVSDIFFLGSVGPITFGLVRGITDHLTRAQRVAFLVDAAALTGTLALILFLVFGEQALITADPVAGAILLAYPLAFIGAAVVGALGGLQLNVPFSWLGINALVVGLALNGLAWVGWLRVAIVELPAVGSPVNYLFSVGWLLVGVGAYGLSLTRRDGPSFSRLAGVITGLVPMLIVVLALGLVVAQDALDLPHMRGWPHIGGFLVVILAVIRQSLLLVERDHVVRREVNVREGEQAARRAAEEALVAQQTSEARYHDVVEVFGRLAEQLSFAADEEQLLKAAAAAIRRLVPASDGEVLLANASQDRLIVGARWGDGSAEVGQAVDDQAPVACLGIRRGSVYSVPDASDELMMPCPARMTSVGSLLCVPMLALGQTIGVIHLANDEPHAFGIDAEHQAARVAQQVALAVANARLVRTMESMALTDPLTRLHNARFFDPLLDRELAAAERDGAAVGVIMIDLDHFKSFNDAYGHAAGDEALRAFARVALSVMRDSDTMARYGGEEFVVAVRGGDLERTADVAERLRSAVERISVEVAAGQYAGFTASFGVAATGHHGTERTALLKAADRALYRAKQAGRNRVAIARAGRAGRRKPATLQALK